MGYRKGPFTSRWLSGEVLRPAERLDFRDSALTCRALRTLVGREPEGARFFTPRSWANVAFDFFELWRF